MSDAPLFCKSDAPYDAIVVGAGASGLYALYHLRKQGYNAMIIEAGGGVSGTWYWNRYPGLRVDIESVEYSYAFDDDLQQEWEWTERYAAQDELERYFNHVADRFDLRKDILLNSRVEQAAFNAATNQWVFKTSQGDEYNATFAIMATGLLSAPNQPKFAGLEDFKGLHAHTAKWPEKGIDFKGKKVAVIGTGSSGIQVIPVIAKEAAHLTVFQRTASFAVPLNNCPMPQDYFTDVKANYKTWREREKYGSFGGWASVNFKLIDQVHDFAMDKTPEEREAMYEDRWQSGGLAFYNVYPDIFANKEANDTLAEFMRRKLSERINNPALEEKLIPTGYPVLTRRLCGETDYYEAYQRDNVKLLDSKADPIERFTETGLETANNSYEFDIIISATGYDAMSGALMRMDIRGKDGETLKDHWSQGDIRTAFGMMAAGFPNMFYISGPGSPAPFYQPMLFCEDQMNWITDALAYLKDHGNTKMEPTKVMEDIWIEECDRALKSTLFLETPSWYVGGNIKDKPSRGLIYFAGIHPYRKYLQDCVSNGYSGFSLT